MSTREGDVTTNIGRDEQIARAFHDTYERLAPSYHYETRPESQTQWALVPADNKKLMIAVVRTLLDEGVINAP